MRKMMRKTMRKRSLFKSKSSRTTNNLINLNNNSKRATNNVKTTDSIKINKASRKATSTVEEMGTSTVEVEATSTVEVEATSTVEVEATLTVEEKAISTVVDLYTQSFVFFTSHFFQNEFVPFDAFFFFLSHLSQILILGSVKSNSFLTCTKW